MRLVTKIKHLLLKYKVDMDMVDEGLFKVTLTDKGTGRQEVFESNSWSSTVDQGYIFMKDDMESVLKA